MTKDQRSLQREYCYAKARFPIKGYISYVRDITSSGCKLIFHDSVEFQAGEIQILEIIPDETVSIDRFPLQVEIRWIRQVPIPQTKSNIWEAGLRIVEVQKGHEPDFLALLAYYNGTKSGNFREHKNDPVTFSE